MTGTSERMRPRASAWLMRRIPQAVADAPGGGCSRAELASVLRVRDYDQVFERSVWACYRRRQIDLCQGYVVVPTRKPQEPVEGETTP
jgi:hypothetical protein